MHVVYWSVKIQGKICNLFRMINFLLFSFSLETKVNVKMKQNKISDLGFQGSYFCFFFGVNVCCFKFHTPAQPWQHVYLNKAESKIMLIGTIPIIQFER